jgi:hypothetical protein
LGLFWRFSGGPLAVKGDPMAFFWRQLAVALHPI